MVANAALHCAYYLLGRKLAEARAKRERDDLIDRVEAINGATIAEIRALRGDIERLHALDAAIEAEHDAVRWIY